MIDMHVSCHSWVCLHNIMCASYYITLQIYLCNTLSCIFASWSQDTRIKGKLEIVQEVGTDAPDREVGHNREREDRDVLQAVKETEEAAHERGSAEAEVEVGRGKEEAERNIDLLAVVAAARVEESSAAQDRLVMTAANRIVGGRSKLPSCQIVPLLSSHWYCTTSCVL